MDPRKTGGAVFMEEDDLSKSSGGGGTEDGKDKGPTSAEQIALLGKAVSFLAQGFEEQKKQSATIAEGQTKLTTLLEALQPKQERKATTTEIFKDLDLENMTDAQKIEVIMKRTEEVVDERVAAKQKAADAKFDQLADAFQQKNAAEAVKSVAAGNPDFFEWAPELKGLLEEQPNLSVQRALTIVRAENPEKVAQMLKKYPKDSDISKRQKSYGLLPTSGTKDANAGKMQSKEAAEKAFDEILAGVSMLHN